MYTSLKKCWKRTKY